MEVLRVFQRIFSQRIFYLVVEIDIFWNAGGVGYWVEETYSKAAARSVSGEKETR